ncbi:helix-turn-helix transcriptional regulator [Nonomuraea sp. SYSU D8015]|uniref:helix-turn-helix transcriptional regulator n=1 Tax=Nonomuraea sp. SYSU D8015 TaxID=2593644 RepID=UPI001CB70CF8|nr:HTH domain-containing protein [Nonomuraea sp. SYSU D8015]
MLQAHPGISAAQLAVRLGVTERTARRDVAQPREVGYRIDAEAGRAGGYRLASGRTMPPLLDAD